MATKKAMLTARQMRFVDEYLKDLNATQAAIRAGYKATTAVAANAARLLKNDKVQEAIEARKQTRVERVELEQDWVVNELRKVAQRCLPVEDDDGKPVANVVSVGVKALELLGRHQGIFIDKREITGKDGKDLVPDAPKGVLVVPGVMSEADWAKMVKERGSKDA